MVTVEYLISSNQYQCDPTAIDFLPENRRDNQKDYLGKREFMVAGKPGRLSPQGGDWVRKEL